jgi:hypothetical protein
MALVINDNEIVIHIPNSEANICAQKNGIKDRSVSSYYLSERRDELLSFLNYCSADFYFDGAKTIRNMKPLYELIIREGKRDSFKKHLLAQYEALMEIEYKNLDDDYLKIESVELSDKYMKIFKEDNEKTFQNLLLGDMTKLVIKKLSNNTFMIYGDVEDNIQDIISRL